MFSLLWVRVPIGTDQYVEYMLDCKIEEIARDLRKIEETLTEHRQAMWNVIRSSISQKLDYWLTLVYPSQMLKAATRMDALLKGAVENLIGIEIPMDGSGGLGYESPIHIPVERQKWKKLPELDHETTHQNGGSWNKKPS